MGFNKVVSSVKSWVSSGSTTQHNQQQQQQQQQSQQPKTRQRSASSVSFYQQSNLSQASSSNGSLLNAYMGPASSFRMSGGALGTGIGGGSYGKEELNREGRFKKPPQPGFSHGPAATTANTRGSYTKKQQQQLLHRRNRSADEHHISGSMYERDTHGWRPPAQGIKRKASGTDSSLVAAVGRLSTDDDADESLEMAATASLKNLNLGSNSHIETDMKNKKHPPASSIASGGTKHKSKRRKFLGSLDFRNLSRNSGDKHDFGQPQLPSSPIEASAAATALSENTSMVHQQHEDSCVDQVPIRKQDSPRTTPILPSTSTPPGAPPPSKEIQDSTTTSPEATIKVLNIRIHELETLVAQKDLIIKILRQELQRPPVAAVPQDHRHLVTPRRPEDLDSSDDDFGSGGDSIHSDSDSHNSSSPSSNDRHHVSVRQSGTPQLQLNLADQPDFSFDAISQHLIMSAAAIGDGPEHGTDVGTRSVTAGGSHSPVISLPSSSLRASVLNANSSRNADTSSDDDDDDEDHDSDDFEDNDTRYDRVTDSQYASFEIISSDPTVTVAVNGRKV